MKSRPTLIAALATTISIGFGAGMAQAEPHVVVGGSPGAAARAGAIWSVGTPLLGQAAAETRAALRAANGDLRAARQELGGVGAIHEMFVNTLGFLPPLPPLPPFAP